jgi:hypothetical protein
MKKILTLSLAIAVTMVSFANDAPSRLTVATMGKNNVRVTVDETKMSKQVGESGSAFDNLTPGYHTVRIYQFGRMVYSAAVQIKPMYSLSIVLNNQGKVIVEEQPLKTDDCNVQYTSYDPAISFGDFTGIKSMMASERNEQKRLVIAEKAIDENGLSSIQVKEMALLFGNESTRLEFAKYAYGKTVDKNNYILVCNTFPFGDNKADLNNYIINYR